MSGSGEVGTVNQLDLKPKASGDIIYLGVSSNGQDVKAGTLIAQLDTTDAQKAVRDAETNLETAKLSMEKLMQPPDDLQLTQSENSLARQITSKQNAEDGLAKAYDDGFNAISNAFLDLPNIISGMHDLLFTTSNQLGGTNVNNIDYYASTAGLFDFHGPIYGADADAKYKIALDKYNANFLNFKTLSRTDDATKIEDLLAQTYDTALAMSDAVKSANNLIQFFEDQMTQHNKNIPALADSQLSTLNGYTGKVNAQLSSLLSITTTIKNNKSSIIDADRSIDESTKSLAKLKAGADTLDIRSSQITIDQRKASLQDAKNALADYYVRAPFDGTIATLNSKKADSVSPSTIIATLITKQKIAEITLNEIDAANVKMGQKVTLTFDAVDGLSIAGSIADVDTLGTVSQGVVSYTVKIGFDTQDDRVKPGMTVNASIVTDLKLDTLAVPSSAVKTRGDVSYVNIIDNTTSVSDNTGIVSATLPREQVVITGLTNDTLTEIVSGLTDGQFIVTRIIAPTTVAPATAPSLFGGGGARMPRN